LIILNEKSLEIVYGFKIKILVGLLLGGIAALLNSYSVNSKNPAAIVSQGFLTYHTQNVVWGEHTEERRTVKRDRFAQVMHGTKISGHGLIQPTIRAIEQPCHGAKALVLAEDSNLTRETTHLIGQRILKNKFLTPLKS